MSPSIRFAVTASLLAAFSSLLWWFWPGVPSGPPEPSQTPSSTMEVVIDRVPIPPFDGQPRQSPPQHTEWTDLPPIPEQPSDEAIAGSRVFNRKLVPLDGGNGDTDSDNASFGKFLRDCRELASDPLFEASKQWLAENADSRWAPSMRAVVAHGHYRRGWFEDARSLWQGLWDDFHERDDVAARVLADEALAHLFDNDIGTGRAERLQTLLTQSEGRPLAGALAGKRFRAGQSVHLLEHVGAQNVMCGPMALNAIQHHLGQLVTPMSLNTVPASYIATGLPLSEVGAWANEHYQLSLTPAKRVDASSDIPTPAVMHARDDHYVALVEQQGDRYFLVDQARSFAQWVSQGAVEAMSSGHFLVQENPESHQGFALLAENEARNVFGRDGAHGTTDPGESSRDEDTDTGNDDSDEDDDGEENDEDEDEEEEEDPCKGMPNYSFNAQLAGLIVKDTPLSYATPVGPDVLFRMTYQDMDSSQPTSSPAYSHTGDIWLCGWIGYIEHVDDPLTASSQLRVHDRRGGVEVLHYKTEEDYFGPDDKSFAIVRKTGANAYERTFPDGRVEVYDIPDNPSAPNQVFLSSFADRNGNTVSLSYDASLRLIAVTDAIGQVTTLNYAHPTDMWKITSVVDPFSRSALLGYDTDGRLQSLTDQIGLTSTFDYQTDGFMTFMTTPYGTTAFRKVSENPGLERTIEAEDPLGGIERIQFLDPGPPISSIEPPETINVAGESIRFHAEFDRLQYRNTYYWTKEAWHEAPGDYQAARNYRWFTNRIWQVGPVLEALKPPLEERMWFAYPGQENALTGGVWPYYPDMGASPSMRLRMIDESTPQLVQWHRNALGHIIQEVDPLGRSRERTYAPNGTDLLEMHQTTGGISERMLKITYDAQGNPLTYTNASNETSTYTYNARGQLLTATTPLGAVTTNTYDADGRLLSVDGPLAGTGDTHTFTYDALSRLKTVTRPDGYSVTYEYDNMDRLTKRTFPDGTYEEVVFDRLHPSSLRDRNGRTTSLIYNALRQPIQMTDTLGREYRFDWCRCGDLRRLIDPMGRITEWIYDIQGRVKEKIFPDGSRISLTRHPSTGQVISRTDEKGQTTLFDYYLDGKRRSLSFASSINPTSNVSYTYDAIYGRPESMTDAEGTTTYAYHPITGGSAPGALRLASIDGPWANDTITFTYDAEQRLVTRAINGVSETVTYDDADRITSLTNALGTFTPAYDGVMKRLSSLTMPGGSKTLYTYYGDSGSRRLQNIRHEDPSSALISEFGTDYDATGRPTQWTQTQGGDPVETWALTHDLAGQLTDVSTTQTGFPNQTYGYEYDLAGNRLAEVIDGSRNESSFNALNQQIRLDTSPTDTTYEWDAADRLLAVQRGTRRSEFTYDGHGRRVRIVELDGASVLSDHRYLWCLSQLCEERTADGSTVVRRFFGSGEQLVSSGAVSLYTRDHLYSVRETLSTTGAVIQQLDYDPWGRQTASLGGPLPMFTYAGLPHHEPSGLQLAMYRQYDPSAGRWLTRDPFGERDGANLYAYVNNQPATLIDPLGLFGFSPNGPSISEFQWHGNYGGPGWANGGWNPDGPLPNPGDPDYKPPVDAADACYEKHDRCFGDCEDCPGKGCEADCDRAVSDCLLKTGNSHHDPWYQELPDWQKPFYDVYIPVSNIPLILEAASFDTWIPNYLHAD